MRPLRGRYGNAELGIERARSRTLPESMLLTWAAILSILNAGVFNDIALNPFGLRGIQEASIALGVLLSCYFFCTRKSLQGVITVAVMYSVIAIGLSAMSAKLTYGQPLHYGLLEERRTLESLAFAGLFLVASASRCPIRMLERATLFAIVLALVLGLLVQFDVLGETVAINATGLPGRGEARLGRAMIGTQYVVLGALIGYANLLRGRERWKWAALLVACLNHLLLVSMTRQVVVGCVLGFVAIHVLMRSGRSVEGWWLQTKRLLLPASLLIATVVGVGVFGFGRQITDSLLETFSAEYLGSNVRWGTVEIIWAELVGSSFAPHGSLSVLWRGGFPAHYGHYFWLADVGLVGMLFRYGIFTPIALGALIVMARRILRRLSEQAVPVVSGVIAYLIVVSPVAAPMEYRGNLVAWVLAVWLIDARLRGIGTEPDQSDDLP